MNKHWSLKYLFSYLLNLAPVTSNFSFPLHLLLHFFCEMKYEFCLFRQCKNSTSCKYEVLLSFDYGDRSILCIYNDLPIDKLSSFIWYYLFTFFRSMSFSLFWVTSSFAFIVISLDLFHLTTNEHLFLLAGCNVRIVEVL